MSDHAIRVWAPGVHDVACTIGGTTHAMSREAGGWWMLARPDDGPVDYAFVLDGHGPFPDPRSRFQPHGVDGPSRTVDPTRFSWTDAGWQPPALETGVLYEIHVGTFTAAGTFDGAIERLGDLATLGVTHVELMPIVEFSGTRGWGYDGVDLFAPHHGYGGPEGLVRFVDAAHAHGLAVIFDVVYNHLGPIGNYLGRFGPYFSTAYSTPWGPAVNFDDAGSDDVRRFCLDNAREWLRDYHGDGLRLDAVHAFYDRSPDHILEELAREVRALESSLGRRLVLIAETNRNDPRIITPTSSGGYGLDALWSDDVHHALHAVLTKERTGYYEDFGRIEDLAIGLRRGFVYVGQYSRFFGRRQGRSPEGLAPSRFVVSAQNHDQIGNRARGERLAQLAGVGRAKIAAAIVLLSPFVPLLFQGEEWGASSPFLYFTDHQDPEVAEAVRRGRRSEFAGFGWNPEDVPDPQAVETFLASRLDWEERRRRPHDELLAWYGELVAMRRTIVGRSNREAIDTAFDEHDRWLTWRHGPVIVACNLADRRQSVPLAPDATGDILLASAPSITLGNGQIDLPASAVAVVRTQERGHA